MYKKKLNKIGNYIEKIKNDINLAIISDFLNWFLEKLEIHFGNKNPNLKIKKGEIYYIKLGQNIGSELNKNRPCIVYSDFYFNNGNTITIIPLKSYLGKKFNKNVNVFIESNNINNLVKNSICDISSIKQISKKRLGKFIGILDINYLEKIDKKILKYFGIKKQTVEKSTAV